LPHSRTAVPAHEPQITSPSIFVAALALSTGLRLWLDLRHLRHVRAHREQVPADFFGRIELVDHRKAADYTAAKVRIGLAEIVVDALVLLIR
jgi:STE24 endopeptidase